jgi:putative Mg2+ transporter-C (MgtC) family protein
MDLAEVTLRLIAATLIGAGVGLNRELRRKPAGLRTHALVALGAALVTVVTLRVGPETYQHVDALSRVIQGIVAGVGFLGGGAILRSRANEEVHGLTTAASIWVVAALGIACGTGQWVASVIGAAITVVVLGLGVSAERFFHRVVEERRKTNGRPAPPPSNSGPAQP